MACPDEPSTNGDAPERSTTVRSDERRRLLRGGLAAGPVIMTVISRPALGGGGLCGSKSNATSVGGSLTCTQPLVVGRSAGYWASTTSWPAPYVSGSSGSGTFQNFALTSPGGQSGSGSVNQGTRFHSSTTGLTGTVFGSHTMLDVLQGDARGGTYKTLGKYVAAALLNAAAGKTSFLTQATIQQMWNDDLNLGYYEVTPGVRWTTSQIVTYLKSTMS